MSLNGFNRKQNTLHSGLHPLRGPNVYTGYFFLDKVVSYVTHVIFRRI